MDNSLENKEKQPAPRRTPQTVEEFRQLLEEMSNGSTITVKPRPEKPKEAGNNAHHFEVAFFPKCPKKKP